MFVRIVNQTTSIWYNFTVKNVGISTVKYKFKVATCMPHSWILVKLLNQSADKDVINAQKRNGSGSEFIIDKNFKISIKIKLLSK